MTTPPSTTFWKRHTFPVAPFIIILTPQEIIRGKQLASMHSDYFSLNDLISNYITTPILPFLCFIGAIGCLIFLFVSEQKDKERKYILNQLEKVENNHYEVTRSNELIDDKINQFYRYIQTVEKEGQLTKDNSRKFIEDVAIYTILSLKSY